MKPPHACSVLCTGYITHAPVPDCATFLHRMPLHLTRTRLPSASPRFGNVGGGNLDLSCCIARTCRRQTCTYICTCIRNIRHQRHAETYLMIHSHRICTHAIAGCLFHSANQVEPTSICVVVQSATLHQVMQQAVAGLLGTE